MKKMYGTISYNVNQVIGTIPHLGVKGCECIEGRQDDDTREMLNELEKKGQPWNSIYNRYINYCFLSHEAGENIYDKSLKKFSKMNGILVSSSILYNKLFFEKLVFFFLQSKKVKK